MSESDITIITEWLHSSGHDTLFTDPTQFLKLLLDEETGRVLSSMLQDRCTPENQYLSIEQIIDSLDELISSRKTLSTRRKEFFGSYNTPRLMESRVAKWTGSSPGSVGMWQHANWRPSIGQTTRYFYALIC